MRYSLRTLLIVVMIGPPLLATAYWAGQWVYAHPLLTLGVTFVLGYLSLWIIGPIVWFHGIVNTICGPSPAKPTPRKSRRVIRVRIGRLVGEST